MRWRTFLPTFKRPQPNSPTCRLNPGSARGRDPIAGASLGLPWGQKSCRTRRSRRIQSDVMVEPGFNPTPKLVGDLTTKPSRRYTNEFHIDTYAKSEVSSI